MSTTGNRRNEFPVAWPAGGLTEVPYDIYTNTEVYALELQRLFRGPVWNYLCLAAELSEPGDYLTTFVGETPVIVTRDRDGALNAMENRCAHRGSLVCIKNRGNAKVLTCVYHSWSYDLKGNLKGIAFEHGVDGAGGMPEDFPKQAHGLRQLRVTDFSGLVFGTYSDQTPPFEEYVGAEIAEHIRRVMHKPVRVLGVNKQYLNNNWKIYIENLRDSYHASLLHTFFNTFRLNRLSQEGAIVVGEGGGHHISYGKSSTVRDHAEYQRDTIRSTQDDLKLADPSLLAAEDEIGDGITTQILTVFPNFGLQRHYNSIAVRHALPKGPGETELIWNYVGFEDDDAAMTSRRIKQANLVGPAGYISLEDGCIGEFVQRGIAGTEGEISIIPMGGDTTESEQGRATETSIRGFWKMYRATMGA
jgi:anthranilate 1,2-dioxygenase large subunit/terephthalate 1,2-dioxygenase oxygenase component alpha subunit